MTRDEFVLMIDLRLKMVRAEYDLTQEKIARILGISKKKIIEVEKGRSSLGWSGAIACGSVFSDSKILQADFGSDLADLIHAMAFQDENPTYPKVPSPQYGWKTIDTLHGLSVEHNTVSDYYRLTDADHVTLFASFDKAMVNERFEVEKVLRKLN